MNILELPDCVIEEVLEYMCYDEIARKRLVCRRIDAICQRILNRGFSKMIKRHNANLKRIKSLLPRRESERRVHPLARHTDVLTCIETRISMLSMTYSKYMDLNLCCFIPGKVIDEVLKILRLIETTTKPLRAPEVLQELRDISSMAIEHFDERIAHLLKKNFMEFNSQNYLGRDDSLPLSSTSNNLSSLVSAGRESPYRCPEAMSNRVIIKRMEQKYKTAIKKFNKMIQIQNKHMRQMRENAVLMSEMNSQITELKKRIEEADAKNREISSNINQSTVEPSSSSRSGGKCRHVKSRTATVILKRRITKSAFQRK